MKIGTELKPYTSGAGGKSIFMEQLAESSSCKEAEVDKLRAEIERRDAVLREVLDSLNRYCVKRQDFDRSAEDIKSIQEVLG